MFDGEARKSLRGQPLHRYRRRPLKKIRVTKQEDKMMLYCFSRMKMRLKLDVLCFASLEIFVESGQ